MKACTFSVAAPSLWNGLSKEVREAELPVFRWIISLVISSDLQTSENNSLRKMTTLRGRFCGITYPLCSLPKLPSSQDRSPDLQGFSNLELVTLEGNAFVVSGGSAELFTRAFNKVLNCKHLIASYYVY